MSNTALIVFVTCPPARAEALAGALVEGRFAACVNILPQVKSVYRWKGQVQKDDEALLIIKTAAGRFEELKQTVLKLHPYELPEVIAVKVEQGHKAYLDWVLENSNSIS
jgi:periplasmic divalent cation tolerance protein